MTVNVLLFGSLARDVGEASVALELSDNGCVGDALAALSERHPEVQRYAANLATAVNLEYVGPDHRLAQGDELALIPPVSGG